MTDIEILQEYYSDVNIDNFVDYFCEVYSKADTATRLALLLHFTCEWYDADYMDLPRILAEIE